MRLKIKYILPIWAISFVVAAITITALNWVFFTSFAVFTLCCIHMEKHQKAYDGDLDELFGRNDRDF